MCPPYLHPNHWWNNEVSKTMNRFLNKLPIISHYFLPFNPLGIYLGLLLIFLMCIYGSTFHLVQCSGRLSYRDSLPGHWPVGGLTNKGHHLKVRSEDWGEVVPLCQIVMVWLCSSTKHCSSCQNFKEELCLLVTCPILHLFRHRVITVLHCV